ncbi:11162_t:CDS:1, partial [Acaulospora morrowiae]
MAVIQDVMHTISPRLAILPDYDGQEPPHTYYAKLRAINETARPLGVAAFNAAERANIMKSKITGRFFLVPAQNPYNTNANIVTEAEVYNWMQGKYRETMIGNQRASLKALINEKFTSLNTINTYEKRIRPYVLGIDDAEVLLYLYDHLPPRLETRIRIANPNTVNDFFMQLRIIWLESGGPTSNFENENNSIPINQFPQKNKALDYLDTIAERLCYSNYGSRDLNDLIKFVNYKLYNRLGHANYNFKKEPFGQDSKVSIKTSKKVYNTKKPIKKFAKKLTKKPIKVTYKCSNCEKIGHRKNMCPGLVKKLKKVNNIYQSEPENSDDEE